MADNDFESAPKAVEAKKQDMLVLEPKYFGPFWKYIENDDITDVDFNGTDLWITDTKNRRIKIENAGVTRFPSVSPTRSPSRSTR